MRIWRDKAKWPKDAPGYMFLGRAIEHVGASLYKEEWREDAPYLEVTENLLAKTRYGEGELVRAERLAVEVLAKRYPDVPPIRLPLLRRRGSARPISKEQWSEALDLVEARRHSEIQARKIFFKVTELMTDWAVAGRLPTAGRNIQGGEFFPISSYDWNAENLADRFEQLQFIPERPFDPTAEAGDASLRWLYVSSDKLTTLMKRQMVIPSGGNTKYRSRYLNFMIKLTDELGLSPENQSTKLSVESSIREKWADDEPLSERLTSAMATLLREPESKLGKNVPKIRD